MPKYRFIIFLICPCAWAVERSIYGTNTIKMGFFVSGSFKTYISVKNSYIDFQTNRITFSILRIFEKLKMEYNDERSIRALFQFGPYQFSKKKKLQFLIDWKIIKMNVMWSNFILVLIINSLFYKNLIEIVLVGFEILNLPKLSPLSIFTF